MRRLEHASNVALMTGPLLGPFWGWASGSLATVGLLLLDAWQSDACWLQARCKSHGMMMLHRGQ